MKTFLYNNWLKLAAIAMLLAVLVSSFSALFALPYAFYQFMNWAVMGAALMIAWQAYKSRKLCHMWLFALVAVAFNPVAPIYLSDLAWQIADIVVVVLFVVSFFLMKEKKS